MRQILNPLVEALQKNETVVLGAIVGNSGSAPRTSGARMLVKADRSLVGSVGGGALEGACQAKADELFAGDTSFAELHFTLSAESAAEAGMVCGGAVSVLLMKVDRELLELFARLQAAYRRNDRSYLATILPQGEHPPGLMFIGSEEDDGCSIDLRREILRKSRRAPFLIDFDDRKFFIEPLLHPGTVHLVGAGHVALATAECAAFAGFEIVVMDDRSEFANSLRYPWAREIRVLDSFKECLQELAQDDYVIIVTRGHLHDREVLAQALQTGAGYIGMIGSRRKREAVYASLLNDGFTEKDLQRVSSPIGLAIGADTPEEIGISIVAELIKTRAGIEK
jgi:xanthine dehydrogenase accessory factor